MEPSVDLEVQGGSRHIEGEETVITELMEAHRTINLDSTRLRLLEELLENGLCTRDI